MSSVYPEMFQATAQGGGMDTKNETKPEPQGQDTHRHPETLNQAEAAYVRHGASPKPESVAAPSASSRPQPPNTSDLNLKTWLLRFQTFVRHQSPDALSSHDVKRFLSALATDHQVSAYLKH